MHKHILFLNRGLYFYLLIVMLLSVATSGHAQTLTITSPPTWSTTQNLDTLYTAAGGSGDHSALVSALGVVDVPASQGTGVYAGNFSLWTLTNAGAIRGDSGVSLGLGGTVTNQNEITARALNGSGVYLANGGGLNSVTNSGTITAGLSATVGGIGVNLVGSPAKNEVYNSWRIYAYGDATDSRGTAVLLNGGGSVINSASGDIIGGYGGTSGIGVYLFGAGKVENYGHITGNNNQGVYINGNGTVTNRTGGTITANGATIGVNIASGVVTNETGAFITGGRNGVVITSTGAVDNSGTISSDNTGLYGVRFSNSLAGTVNNSGTIQGQTGISFGGSGDDSLINSGIINGRAGTAVQMGGGADKVTLKTGSIITGTIDGGAGSDTLTLLGSGSVSTGQLLNFETIIKDGSEKWILKGTGSTGGNLNINQGELAASGTITGNVTVGNDGMLSPGNSPGTFTINGNFSSSGNLEFEIGGLGAGLCDVLDINGGATFTGGSIHFDFASGFNAKAGDSWNFLFANSIDGWNNLAFDFHGLGTGLGWEFEQIAGGERLLITQSGGGSPVPEPTTMLLVCLGLVGIAGVKRKFKT
jgi:hypothetical protein